MELVHTTGIIHLHADEWSVVIDPNLTVITLKVCYQPEHTLADVAFKLPLSAEFFLRSCKMRIDGVTCKDMITTRAKAEAKFQSDKWRGSSASTVGMEHDYLLIKLGNMHDLKMELVLVGTPVTMPCVLDPNRMVMQLHVPTGVRKPPYQTRPKGQADMSAEMADSDLSLVKGNFDIRVKQPYKLISVSSETHSLDIQGLPPQGNSTSQLKGTMKVGKQKSPGGLLLRLQLERGPVDSVIRANDQEFGDIIVMNSVPQLDKDGSGLRSPKEVIFMVDCSGSMRDSMEKVRECLQLLVKCLPQGSMVNIFCFGSVKPRMAFEFSLVVCEYNMTRVRDFAAKMHADMCGTDVLGAINYLSAYQNLPSHKRVVVIITDGAVDNPEECGRRAAMCTGVEQWHGLGIGVEASSALLKSITEHSSGLYKVLARNESRDAILSTAGKLLHLASLPAYKCSFRVVNDTAFAIKYPRLIRGGCPFTVILCAKNPISRWDADFCQCKSELSREITLILTMDSFSFSTTIGPEVKTSEYAFPIAARHVLSLYDESDKSAKATWLHYNDVKFMVQHFKGAWDSSILTGISLSSGILCPSTALSLVCDTQEDASDTAAPCIVMKYWHMIEGGGQTQTPSPSPSSRIHPSGIVAKSPGCNISGSAQSDSDIEMDRVCSRAPRDIIPRGAPVASKEPVISVEATFGMEAMRRASVEGTWTSSTIPTGLPVAEAPPPGHLSLHFASHCNIDEIWQTMRVIHFWTSFDICHLSTAALMLIKKGKQFLVRQSLGSASLESIFQLYFTE